MARNDIEVDDRLSSILALTHAIQNRVIQSSQKGHMSKDVAREISNHTEMISHIAFAVAKLKKEE